MRIHGIMATAAAAALSLAASADLAHAQSAATFDAIKARGTINCGVNTGLAGFAAPDSQGVWRGLDVDLCRAVAAAMFGDASKVRYVPTTAQQRFTALQSGEVDMLSRNTTWTLSRDTSLGLDFVGVNFYDGQGFMVKRALGVNSAKELNGATVCVQPGTTTELNLTDWFRANNMRFTPVVIERLEEVNAAFFAGRCDALTTDVSGLASVRASQGPRAEEYVILPEVISKEPLGPVVRHGDNRWADLVRWAHFAMIEAEELGLTSANIDQHMNSTNPAIQRFVGATGGLGEMLGVDNRWAYNIVKQVGNYGESFDRNVKPLGIQRGINDLWTKGGLMYSPPIR
ncbi:amino acid ABC transporter substrate-binding protein [Elioraea tepidiphila]|jgi:general L-amino acid transport system substrate-binding protein|uniref:amino acid ABC transporter substrate-binding protein n=1 Tax=Elioraea tepidiphila TaxID=457934 RepID=UPI00036932B6|nr:amino acid ABC transporter substrate-binding protein [Elioraea tepidiphila]